jgi:outer membrane receptor protein involved in Fe transport
MKINRISVAISTFVVAACSGAQAQQPASDQLAEVQVTGSRIQQTGMTTPTPVTAVSAAELTTLAPATLAEGLAQLPQFFASTTTASTGGFFTSPGAGNLNLRGLGTNRTLTLLNGRRIVSSTRFGGTDINIFPEAMLKSVETVTGGASAAYGTDAIAGVVNFILDTSFTGFRSHFQSGVTSRGDNKNGEASISGGFSLGERTHVLLSAEMFKQDGVFTLDDRDWYESWGAVTSPTSNTQTLIRPNVISTRMTLDGRIISTAPSIANLQFQSNGQTAPFTYGNPYSLSTNTGSLQSHSVAAGGSGVDNNSEWFNLQPKSARDSLFLYADHDLSTNTQVFVQAIYGHNNIYSRNTGGLWGGVTPLTIYANNAFLPQNVRDLMATNNIASFELGRVGSVQDLAENAATEMDSKTKSGTFGFKSRISSSGFLNDWNVQGYGQVGSTITLGTQIGGVRLDRLYLATDAVVNPATGKIACNVTLVSGKYPDCVPLNLFGRGNASPEAIDWVIGFDPGKKVTTPIYYVNDGYARGRTVSYVSGSEKVASSDIKQKVAELSMDGKVWDGWGAGPISTALGSSWREDSIDQIVYAPGGNPATDQNLRPVPANDAALGIRGVPSRDRNVPVEMQYSNVPNLYGSIRVVEFYNEWLVPLVSNLPMLKQLNFNGGTRWAEYSGSGAIWAWKVGLDAEVNDQLRFRGTVSKDVRAATLAERFDKTGGAGSVRDPKFNNESYGITLSGGGNPNLEPENADTLTVGAVYRPDWLSGFSASLDWYRVAMTGAIGQLTPQDIVDQCQLGATDLCGRIIRNSTTNRVELVNAVYLNVNKSKVSGLDLELAYRRSVDWFGGGERITARLFGTYLMENSSTNFGAAKVDRAGQTGGGIALPDYKFSANVRYSRGPLSLSVQARYISSGLLDANEFRLIRADDNTVDAVFYTDLNATWQPVDAKWRVYANTTNLFDAAPPVTASFGTFGGTSNQTNPALFDLLGRRFMVGVGFDF